MKKFIEFHFDSTTWVINTDHIVYVKSSDEKTVIWITPTGGSGSTGAITVPEDISSVLSKIKEAAK